MLPDHAVETVARDRLAADIHSDLACRRHRHLNRRRPAIHDRRVDDILHLALDANR